MNCPVCGYEGKNIFILEPRSNLEVRADKIGVCLDASNNRYIHEPTDDCSMVVEAQQDVEPRIVI